MVKKIYPVLILGIFTLSLSSCTMGIFNRQAELIIPLETKLQIIGSSTNEKQELFLALYDEFDDKNYVQKITPDSIICYIDDDVKTPILEIYRTYVLKTDRRYYRYHDKSFQHQPDQHTQKNPDVTITYHVKKDIFIFYFPNETTYKNTIPEKMQKKSLLIIKKHIPPKQDKKPIKNKEHRKCSFFYIPRQPKNSSGGLQKFLTC